MHRRRGAVIVRFTRGLAAVALLALAFAAPAAAQQRIGIVLLHGKLGVPLGTTSGRAETFGAGLIAALRNAGYLVAAPEMCWSRQRGYDKTYPDCVAEIDAAIAQLKAQGATAIVVGGLSLGGNGAIAYGATHTGIVGIVGFGPADDPTRKSERPEVMASLTRARQLVAQGQGDVKTTFGDVNTGGGGSYAMAVTTTPRIFLSFNDSDALTHIPANVAKLTAPILWIAGDSDPTQRASRLMFDKAPANPLNRYVEVHANHLATPDAGTAATLEWLAALGKS
ncbi:MAG: alpha/beta fold hydrolase [Alphaproteobacteria bacterium]|nr:alpha/beta fold hydrolase [Alphaproteobacteria bacterium]